MRLSHQRHEGQHGTTWSGSGVSFPRYWHHILPLLITLLIPACGIDRGAGDMTRETLSSGVVRTTWHRLPFNNLKLDTLAVWDIWSENEEYVFGDITAAGGSADGFHLVDAGSRKVVRVDLYGHVQHIFGHQGMGPGEFQYPLQIFIREDEIWVSDLVLIRYSVFNQAGSFLRAHTWAVPARNPTERFAITPADGELYTTRIASEYRALVHSPFDGGASDTITVIHTPPLSGTQLDLPGVGPTTMYDPPGYSMELQWAYAPDGRVLTATTTEYRIDVRDLTGRLVQQLVAPTPDLTVTAADRSAYIADLAHLYDRSVEEFRRLNPRLESQYPFAERRSAIAGLRLDPLGRIWVLANIVGTGRQRLDIFNSDFDYLGSLMDLPLPEAFLPGGEILFRIADYETGADLFFVADISME